MRCPSAARTSRTCPWTGCARTAVPSTEEESRVSYWRRIIQARLDLVRAAEGGTVTPSDNLRGVFAEARVDSGRKALLTVVPIDDMPPLPDLVEVWARPSG